MALQPSLSSLTPEVVDRIFGVDRALPNPEPTFLFLVGPPGSGKSSGHAAAIDAGLLPDHNYATINVDTLLETLTPFRAASSMAHLLKQEQRDLVKFSPIGAYGTRKDNLGLFDWYNSVRKPLDQVVDHATISMMNSVRGQFRGLQGHEAPKKLLELTREAMERAIGLQVPIVYETTLSLTKKGRVTKVDEIMELLASTPYRVAIFKMEASPADLASRIRARQEYGMTYEWPPYYRYVPASEEKVAEYIEDIDKAVSAIQTQYPAIVFGSVPNPFDPAKLPPSRVFDAANQRKRIMAAYGPYYRTSNSLRLRSSSNRTLRSSWRVSTSSEPRRTSGRRKTRKAGGGV